MSRSRVAREHATAPTRAQEAVLRRAAEGVAGYTDAMGFHYPAQNVSTREKYGSPQSSVGALRYGEREWIGAGEAIRGAGAYDREPPRQKSAAQLSQEQRQLERAAAYEERLRVQAEERAAFFQKEAEQLAIYNQREERKQATRAEKEEMNGFGVNEAAQLFPVGSRGAQERLDATKAKKAYQESMPERAHVGESPERVDASGLTHSQRRAGQTGVGTALDRTLAGASPRGTLRGTPHYRKGGVVNKTGLAVVHKGELVVPAEVVPKVLKSNAWLDHVRAVRAKHGGTMKEAMKIAKGTYRRK